MTKDNSRIYGTKTEIQFNNIQGFYNCRANEINSSLHAVMLQNINSDLPIKRHEFEKDIIYNKLSFNQQSKILDLGCGPG